MLIPLILLRKINGMSIHSLFYFAAEGGEYLLRQAPEHPLPAAVWLRQTAAGRGCWGTRRAGGPPRALPKGKRHRRNGLQGLLSQARGARRATFPRASGTGEKDCGVF
jgi:hypothetical protein